MENGSENIESVHSSDSRSKNIQTTESDVEAKDYNNSITENVNAGNYKRERELSEEQEDHQHLHFVQEIHDKNIVLEQKRDEVFIGNDNDNDQLQEEVDEMEDNNDDDDDVNVEFVDMLWRTSELQALLATHRNQHYFAVATASFEKCTLEKFYLLINKLLLGMTALEEKQQNSKLEENLKEREEGEQSKTLNPLQNKANNCVTLLQPCVNKHLSRVSSANNLLSSCIYNKLYNKITETTTNTDGVFKFSTSKNYEYKANTTLHAYNIWRSCQLQQYLRNLFNLLYYECEKYHDEIRHYSTIRRTMERYMPVLQYYWSNLTTKLENVITDSKTALELELLQNEKELLSCQLSKRRSKAEQEQKEQLEPFVPEEEEEEWECEEMENWEELYDFTKEGKRISEDVQFVHLLENATSLITLPQRQEAMTQLLNYLSVLCEENMEYITHITPTLQRKILWYKDKVTELMPMIEECAMSTAQHNLSVMNRCMNASYELIPYYSTKELFEFSTETKEEQERVEELMLTEQSTNCFAKYMHLMNKRSQLQLTLLMLCTLYSKQDNTTIHCNDTTDDYDNASSRQQAHSENHIDSPTHIDYALESKELQKERQELIKESVTLTREMVYMRCLQKEWGTLFVTTKDKSKCSHVDTNDLSDANEKEEVNKEVAQDTEDFVTDAHTRQLMKPKSVVEHITAVSLMEQLRINLTNILCYALTQLFCYEGDKKEIKTKERAEGAVSNKHDDENNINNNNNNTHEMHIENHTTEYVEDITSSADTLPLDLFNESSMSDNGNIININFFANEVNIAQLTYLYENVLSRSHSLYALLTENGRWREELASFDKTLHILLGADENVKSQQNNNVINVNFVQNANNQCIANYDSNMSNNKENNYVCKAVMEIASEIKRAMGLSLQEISVKKFQQQHLEKKNFLHDMLMSETHGHTCTSNDDDDGNDDTLHFTKCENEKEKASIDTNIRNEVLSELLALSENSVIPIQIIEEEILQKYNELHKELMLSASCFVEEWDKECVEPVRQLCGDVAFLIRLYLLQIEQVKIDIANVQFDNISNYKSNANNWEVNSKLLELLQILDNLTGKADNTENNITNQQDTTIISENVERTENNENVNSELANKNTYTMNKITEEENMATSLINKIVPSSSLLPDSATRVAEIYKPFASLLTANNTQLESIKQKYATEDSSVHDLTQFVEWCSGVDVQNIQTLLATAQDANLQLELQLCVKEEAQKRKTLNLEVQEAEEFKQILRQECEERKSVTRNIRKARIANRSAYLTELENKWQELQRHNVEMERQLEELSQHQKDKQRQQQLQYEKEEEEREEQQPEPEPEQEQEQSKDELEEEQNQLEPSELEDQQTKEEHVVKNDESNDEEITQNDITQNTLAKDEDILETERTEVENEKEQQLQQDREKEEENQEWENRVIDHDEETENNDNIKVDNEEGDEVNSEQDVKEIHAANSDNENSNNKTDAWQNSLVEDTSETGNNAEISDHSSISNDNSILNDQEDVNLDDNALVPDTDKDVVNILNFDSAEHIEHDVNNTVSNNDELGANRETVEEELEKLQTELKAKLAESKEIEIMSEQTKTTEQEIHSENEEGKEEVQQEEQQKHQEEKEKEQELKELSNVDFESTLHEGANTSAQNISSPFLDDFAFDDDDVDDNNNNEQQEKEQKEEREDSKVKANLLKFYVSFVDSLLT